MEPHSAFNTLDYIVIGVVLLSGLLALIRGLMREIFSLIAWVGAYFAAVKYYPLVLPMVHHHIKHDKTAEWVAMAGVFVIALILLMIFGFFVCGLVRGKALTSIDRSLGFIYGLVRGALVVSLLYMVVVIVFWPDIDTLPATKPADTAQKTEAEQQQQDKDHTAPPDLLLEAKTRPALAYGASVLKNIIPKEMLDKTLKDVEQQKTDAEERAKAEADKAARQQMLNTLSTPAPPSSSHSLEGGGQPSNQGTKP